MYIKTHQNLWDDTKVVLKGKIIATNTHIKQEEKFWINNLTLYYKELEKEEQKLNSLMDRSKMSFKILIYVEGDWIVGWLDCIY